MPGSRFAGQPDLGPTTFRSILDHGVGAQLLVVKIVHAPLQCPPKINTLRRLEIGVTGVGCGAVRGHRNAERGLRGACVGRRAHFGSTSGRGTEVAAILLTLVTLVETARLHERDPAEYLLEAARAAKLNKDAVTLPGA